MRVVGFVGLIAISTVGKADRLAARSALICAAIV